MTLAVRQVNAAGYRSLRSISFPVEQLTVLLGANGVGKTNLYRTLQLLQAAATGRLCQELVAEGGMESAFWAGLRPAKPTPVRITLAAEFAGADGDARSYGYEVSLGMPSPMVAALPLEPQVKEESLTFRHGGRRYKLLERRGPRLTAWNDRGKRVEIEADLLPSETALAALQDPSSFPDLDLVRRTMLDWRFYHEMRTDAGSPLRQPCLAVTSPTLASDGSNLAAVFATLAHIRGDTTDLDRAIEEAFPGVRLVVPMPG